jgi:RimJ/RimL family protein N-acetyltransferase
MAAIRSHPEVSRWLDSGSPDRESGVARFEHHLRHWEQHAFGLFMVELRSQAELVGWTGPAHPDQVPGLEAAVEVGWTLRPDSWGRGLATEAASSSITAAFAHLEVPEVISLIHASNDRSIAVAKRLGMEHTRDARHAEAGCLRVYSVARVDWCSQR